MEAHVTYAHKFCTPLVLRPNHWNTNIVSIENEAKIDASIKRFGFFKPVIVRTLPDKTLEILGGQHRVESAIRLGITEIPIIDLGTIPDHQAKEIGLVDNGRYGVDDNLALANLLKSLGTAEELSSFLPYVSEDLTSIFSATDIDLASLDLDDDPADSDFKSTLESSGPTHQIMRFKVPIEDVSKVTDFFETIMKSRGFTTDDSLTNAGAALVWAIYNLKITE